jgi:hypothetical protein
MTPGMIPAVLTVAHGGSSMCSNSPGKTLVSVGLQPSAAEMRKLRGEMHRRMLGNGFSARPVQLDCHFETICESCTYFVTTIEFRPTLRAQRDDPERKGQVSR